MTRCCPLGWADRRAILICCCAPRRSSGECRCRGRIAGYAPREKTRGRPGLADGRLSKGRERQGLLKTGVFFHIAALRTVFIDPEGRLKPSMRPDESFVQPGELFRVEGGDAAELLT
jgi:hypothetical protein